MMSVGPKTTPAAAVTYSPATAATLIPAVATPAMGMCSPAKVAVSKTTLPSPMPPLQMCL